MHPMVHVHTTKPDSLGRDICTACGEAVVKPILDFDDPRLNPPAVFERLRDLGEAQGCWDMDMLLIEMCELLGVEWPPYIMILVEAYHGGEPPHVVNWWWRRDDE